MKVNPSRPIQELSANNRYGVDLRLGRIHCMTPTREQLRAARPTNLRKAPPALRRGWVKYALETIADNQDTYTAVVTGRFS